MGTIINGIAIIIGGLIGIKLKSIINKKIQDALLIASGVSVLFMGLSGGLKGFSSDNDLSIMIILSLVVGTLIGELIDIEGKLNEFGKWLKKKTNSNDDNLFLDAFIMTSLTVCVGAMAIIGSINDGLYGNYNILLAKAILDFIIVMVLASSLGKGAIFSFIPVVIFQGSITILASLVANIMTDLAISYISIVGSILIFLVGVNLIFDSKIRVANMLPSILISLLFLFF